MGAGASAYVTSSPALVPHTRRAPVVSSAPHVYRRAKPDDGTADAATATVYFMTPKSYSSVATATRSPALNTRVYLGRRPVRSVAPHSSTAMGGTSPPVGGATTLVNSGSRVATSQMHSMPSVPAAARNASSALTATACTAPVMPPNDATRARVRGSHRYTGASPVADCSGVGGCWMLVGVGCWWGWAQGLAKCGAPPVAHTEGVRACPLAIMAPDGLSAMAVTSAVWQCKKICSCGSVTSASTTFAPSAYRKPLSWLGCSASVCLYRPVYPMTCSSSRAPAGGAAGGAAAAAGAAAAGAGGGSVTANGALAAPARLVRLPPPPPTTPLLLPPPRALPMPGPPPYPPPLPPP